MIQLRKVRKSFHRTGADLTVVTVEEFGVEAGERVAVVGASGSGKATLWNLISGPSLPDSGSVHVDGLEVTGPAEPARDLFRARRRTVLAGAGLLAGAARIRSLAGVEVSRAPGGGEHLLLAAVTVVGAAAGLVPALSTHRTHPVRFLAPGGQGRLHEAAAGLPAQPGGPRFKSEGRGDRRRSGSPQTPPVPCDPSFRPIAGSASASPPRPRWSSAA